MQEFIDKFVQYGYILVFLYSLGGGMLALLALGVFASAYNVNPYISILVAFLGNFLGSSALFYFTRTSKKDFQKHLVKHRRKLALLVVLFRKNGFIFTFVCKFIYGLKTLGPIAAEISKLSFVKFSVYNLISCIIWAIAVFYIAYFLGESLGQFFDEYSSYMPIVLLILLVIIFIYFKIKAKK